MLAMGSYACMHAPVEAASLPLGQLSWPNDHPDFKYMKQTQPTKFSLFEQVRDDAWRLETGV